MAYRSQPGTRISHAAAGRRRGRRSGRHARPAARLPRAKKLATDLQVHAHRPAHAGQDAARPPLQGHARARHGDRRRAGRAGEASRRRRRPGRRGEPARPSGEWEWAASAINRVLDAVTTTPAVHLCFGNYGGQSVQKGSWEQLDPLPERAPRRPRRPRMRAPAARGARGVQGVAARDRLRPRRRRHQSDRGRIGRRDRARDRARRARLLGAGRVRYIHPDCGFWMLKRGRSPTPRSARSRRAATSTRGALTDGRRGVGPVRPESGRLPTRRPRRHRRERSDGAARIDSTQGLGERAWTTPGSTSSKTARSFATT